MDGSAVRLIACAGLLASGLLMGGAGAGIAVADTGDSTGEGAEGASVTSKVDSGSDGAGNATKPDPPTSTVGSGRDDVDVKSPDEDKKKDGFPTGIRKFKGSLMIPILRIPRKDELPTSGLPNPALFYTTVEIPVPGLAEVFAAMQPQPQPSPNPGPAFRTQEEGPPVADSGGGGVDPLSTGVAAEPPVLRAPIVIAPPPIPRLPASAPVAPLGTSAEAPPAQVVAADAVAVGARAPVIRGSLPPTAEPPTGSLTPMSGQATRLGYPRYLRNPTVGELAAVALPGAAGLLFFTFSGGFIGYRQANSARFIRAQGAERFLR
ncbi:MAG: hypothetical protein QOD36_2147 [Mycobacterium sp.]|nr:hypothetical protein [Mycobacterium sp.]